MARRKEELTLNDQSILVESEPPDSAGDLNNLTQEK